MLLLSDKPIKSAKDDLLGFSSFADALAISLTEMVPEEGIVISIEGAWGTGKTSAIELIEQRIIIRELAREKFERVEHVESSEWFSTKAVWDDLIASRRTHILRFNPWNFSGQENLVRAFFTEIGDVIGHPPDGPIGRAIKKITDYLPGVGVVAGAGAAALVGGPSAATIGATTGKAIGDGAQRLLASPPSLEKAKQELAAALSLSKKRIIIIIDDLDRLLPTEMRAMFSLVKSLGDLPNLLYVLSFDRDVVTKALRSGAETIESEFLEKIIQVQLKLPPPWQSEIRTLFFNRLNRIIGDAVPNDQERWNLCFLDSIAPYIQTPRDVSRFSNTLQVIWPNVAGDVDLTDFIILTTLQLFDSTTYAIIFESIEDLAGENITFVSDEEFSNRFEPVKSNNPTAARNALGHLFPKLMKGWNKNSWDGTVYVKKREQRRICTSEYYRNYFLFGLDPDRLSRAEIEQTLSDQNPEKKISSLIERLSKNESRHGKSRVALLLEQIFEIVFTKPLLSNSVVTALLNLSDELILREDRVWEFGVENNLERLNSIMTFGLAPLSASERDERVAVMRQHNRGLMLAAVTIDRLAGHHGLYGGDERFESEKYISRTTVIEAAGDILHRIRNAAYEGSLLNLPMSLRLIWIWKQFSSAEEVKLWLFEEVKSDKSVLRLAQILPHVSFRSSSKGREEVRSFKAATYKEILDCEHFKQRLASMVSNDPENETLKKIQQEFLAAEAIGSDERF